MTAPAGRLCLVTGATSYLGGRLVPPLLEAGHRVRVMVRDERRVEGHPWSGTVEIAVADASGATAVRRALDGVDVAHYLLHSIGTGGAFADTEARIARPSPTQQPMPVSSGWSTWTGSHRVASSCPRTWPAAGRSARSC